MRFKAQHALLFLSVIMLTSLKFLSFSFSSFNNHTKLAITATISENTSYSCDIPTYFVWHCRNDFGMNIREEILPKYGFNMNCSIANFALYSWELKKNSNKKREPGYKWHLNMNNTLHERTQLSWCLKRNTKPIHSCDNNGRIVYYPNRDKHLVNMLEKHSLYKLLTQYCNEYDINNTICNFKLLSFDMQNPQQRINFLSKYINCNNNESLYNNTWVFKEHKHAGTGVHFINNHQLIYKLISPNIHEANIYYKHCLYIKPFSNDKYLKKEGFTYTHVHKREHNGHGFKVDNKHLHIQEFVYNPLLLENRLFHLRSFMLIISLENSFIVLHYPEGMILRNPIEFTGNYKQLNKNALRSNAHVTDDLDRINNFTQIWGYHRYQMYLDQMYGNELYNYTQTKLQNDIKHIIGTVFTANEYNNGLNDIIINSKIPRNEVQFHIYCMDISVTDTFELKLLEMNARCGQVCANGYQTSLLPKYNDELDNGDQPWMCDDFSTEIVEIMLEMYKKRYYNISVGTINSLRRFSIAYKQ